MATQKRTSVILTADRDKVIQGLAADHGINQTQLLHLAVDRLLTSTRFGKPLGQPDAKTIDNLTQQRDELVTALAKGQRQKALMIGLYSTANAVLYIQWLAKELGMSVPQLIGLADPVDLDVLKQKDSD